MPSLHSRPHIQNTDNGALFNTVEAALCSPLSMQPNQQHKQCVPVSPVITVNKFNTWMCCRTYTNRIHRTHLTLLRYSPSPFLVQLPLCLLPLILYSFPPRSLLLSTPSPPTLGSPLLFPTLFFPTSFLSHTLPFLPPSFSHLSDLNTCIMHGEGESCEETCLCQ